VVDYLWNPQSPLQKAVVPGRLGAQTRQPGIALTELSDFSLVQVMARRGQWAATAKAAKKLFKIDAPERPVAAFGKKGTLLWSGPDQFMALSAGSGMPDRLAPLRQAFAGVASLSDQSDGRCLIRISGAGARAALAKLSSLDLHDKIFPVGAAAATSIDHTGVNLWRAPDGPDGNAVFLLLVFSSFADSLWHTLVDAASEYGIEADTGRAFFLTRFRRRTK
jgi:methylglutamate dehydrogenase subunit D